jgi:VanZ family protein
MNKVLLGASRAVRFTANQFLQTAAILSIALIGVLSLMPKALRDDVATSAPGYVEHCVAYMFTGALVRLAFPRAAGEALILRLVGYAALLEALQLMVPGRTSQFIDMAFSGLGAASGVLIAGTLRADRK